jgi:hypothetical protein
MEMANTGMEIDRLDIDEEVMRTQEPASASKNADYGGDSELESQLHECACAPYLLFATVATVRKIEGATDTSCPQVRASDGRADRTSFSNGVYPPHDRTLNTCTLDLDGV